MRAIQVKQPGGPEQLSLEETPDPQPGSDEVRIRVTAAGINRADLLQRQGHYPPPAGASTLLGLEVSGEIDRIGPLATQPHGWKVGDRVCALLAGGGYAEYAIAHAGSCLKVPETLSLPDAAALPEAIFTVWANLFSQAPGQATAARVLKGERLLVQGGTSGIGSMALQMAHARGIHTAATAGSADKCAKCFDFGADFAVDYHTDWAEQLHAWAPSGFDCILDMVAGPYLDQHLKLLAPGGRLTHIATAQGSSVTLDLRTVMLKRLVVTGSHLRSRSNEQKRALRDEIETQIWPLVADQTIRPIIDRRFPLAQAAEAHRALEQGGHIGKLLLLA